jgi:mandelate racemase
LIEDLGAERTGKPIRPLDDFQTARKALNLIGYEGVAMAAISGLDIAAWDALSTAANLPLARFLGGSVGAVPAYNSNGLWLGEISKLGNEAERLTRTAGSPR